MSVRRYEPRDFPRLVLLGGDMHAASDFSPFQFDVGKLRQLAQLVDEREDLVAFVSEAAGRVTGMMVGGVAEFFFGQDRYGFDLLLYVEEQRRGSMDAFRLVRAFEGWCRERGVAQLRLGAATGINPEQADRFFQKAGFQRGGILYTRNLRDL